MPFTDPALLQPPEEQVSEVRDGNDEFVDDLDPDEEGLVKEIDAVQEDMMAVGDHLARYGAQDRLIEWAVDYEANALRLEDENPGLAEEHTRRAREARALGDRIRSEQFTDEEHVQTLVAAMDDLDPAGPQGLQTLRALEDLGAGSRPGRGLEQRVAEALTAGGVEIEEAAPTAAETQAETLRRLKVAFAECLDAADSPKLLALLKDFSALELSWEEVRRAAIGKELGRCAKVEDESVAIEAKTAVARLHRLAKEGGGYSR